MIPIKSLVVLLLLTFGLVPDVKSQEVSRPRIGVVLSGGGAKGIAHIGVLRVLESEGIHADIVTGTSMGALVGGLYAIGHTTASLDSLVRRLDWASYFLDDPERRFLSLDRRFVGERTMADLALRNWHVSLPTGVVRGQRISELLSRLTWPAQGERDFTRYPRPFAALGTDIETGEAVVLDSGSLATSLRASMSIPGLFDPVRVGARLLVDGGVTRNLPAREARRLGADILICSDVADPLAPSAELESLVDVLLQTMSIYVDAVSGPDRQLCDVLIRPNAHGTGLDAADFAEAARWIAIGDSAANAQRAKLREIAARAGGTRVPAPALAPVRATSLRITGLGGAIEDFARRRLHLPMPTMVSPDRLEDAVARLYATELFNRVTYELDARGGDTAVVVNAEPRARDQLGVGVRYDDTYDAALLLSARLRNRLGVGSTTQLDLRLGEQVHAGVEHLSPGIGGTPLAAGAAAGYSYSPMLLYVADARVGNARVNVTSASVFGSVLRGEEAAIGIELKGEHADVSRTVLGIETTRRQTYASGAVVARSNTLDRAAFPSRGHMLSLRSEYVVGPTPFAHHVGHALLAIPLASRITLAGRAAVGASFPASAVPLHYVFMLGGVYPQVLFPETQVAFVGLRPQQRQGTAMTRVGAALQWEPSRRVFVTLRADAGRVGDKLVWNPDAFSAGYGGGVGALTPAGPVELFVSGRSGAGRPLLNVSLGNAF